MNDQEKTICERALKAWGLQAQLDMVIEEMAELTKAIIKYRRGKDRCVDLLNVLREGIDVQIMVMQLETIFPSKDWQMEKQAKLNRIQVKLDQRGL